MVVEFLQPIEIPAEVAKDKILVKTSITNKNKRGEIRSPWQSPLEALEKSGGENSKSM